jgi:hypothetical protein
VTLSLALTGCAASQPRPARGSGAGPSGQAARADFGWFHPGPAPGTWLRASLTGRAATLSYPGSLRPMRSDPGTVSFGSTSPSGLVLVYLNVTPRQGDETLRDWPGFRASHLREEGQTAVRVDHVSPSLNFRGGHGRCVIDSYTTKVRANRYREIACYVRGARAASVLVAATATAAWQANQGLLERVISAYQAG